jgi:hypothetical protein
MRNVSKLLLVLSLIAFAAFISCSNGTDSNKTEGDPEDPNFQMAQGFIEGFVDSTFNAARYGTSYLTFDGNGPLNVTEDTMYVVFDEMTCWWEIYVSYSDTTGLSYTFIDSVKFQDASGCQQFPDTATTTEIEYRAYADAGLIADSISMTAILSQNMLITGIQGDYVVVNTSGSEDLDMTYGQADYAVDFDGTVIDLTFLRDDVVEGVQAYPLSGTMFLSMTVSTVWPNGSSNMSWTADITFYEDHYHVYAVSGDNYWEWDVYYQQPL